MEIIRLIEIALAGWCIAHALTNTHGPGGVFDWIRENIPHGRHGVDAGVHYNTQTGTLLSQPPPLQNGLLDCIICLMPWICVLLWLVPDGIILWAFASAGLALLLHGFTGWRYNG